MPRGITENDVHGAADALVSAGERPTVERIRAHLGTGSPNTVTRWLDTWWGRLGERLAAQRTSAALPAAPPEVVELASQWWEHALAAASALAKTHLADAFTALATERAALAHADQDRQVALANAQTALEQAQQTRMATEQRLDDLQRWCDQQREQLSDLTQQRDQASDRAARRDAECAALVERAQAKEAEWASDRQRHNEHLRAAEDRAHAQVDRSRQEVQTLKKQLDAAQRAHRALQEAQHAGETALRQELASALREAAVARAEANATTAERAKAQRLKTVATKPSRRRAAAKTTPKGRSRMPSS